MLKRDVWKGTILYRMNITIREMTQIATSGLLVTHWFNKASDELRYNRGACTEGQSFDLS